MYNLALGRKSGRTVPKAVPRAAVGGGFYSLDASNLGHATKLPFVVVVQCIECGLVRQPVELIVRAGDYNLKLATV